MVGCEINSTARMGLITTFSVVWVPDPNLVAVGSQDGLTPSTVEQPDQTLTLLEEFKPEEWGLPPYDE